MPEVDARLLLAYVLQQDHSYLLAHDDVVLTAVQQQQYDALLQRAAQAEPIPYLCGTAPFFGLDFTVNPAVLIPRPETEELVELVLAWARASEARDIMDVGTGSGCIAVALAANLPQAKVQASDRSRAALQVALDNVARLAPGRVALHEGDLLQPVSGPFDIIVANLPYIAADEWSLVDDAVKSYEPMIALDGGADGLDLILKLLQQAPRKLRAGGAVFLEIGWRQGQAVQQAARAHFPAAELTVLSDFAGHDRFLRVVA